MCSFFWKTEFACYKSSSVFSTLLYRLQGDMSGCSQGFVDIKIEAAIELRLLILKLNFCFVVNRTQKTTLSVTL